jgi:DNA-binding MarR family transcriptional regulator
MTMTRHSQPPTAEARRDRTPAGQYFTEILLETFRLNGRLLDAGDRMTKDLGLSSARWQVLGTVDTDSLTVAAIARRMGLRRQSVQRTVNSLHADGFVELVPNPNHRRAKLVQITAKGTVALRAAFERQAVWANELARGIDEDDLDRALKVMATLRQRLEQAAR